MKEAMVERLVEAVKGIAGEGYEVKSTVVKKNNGVELADGKKITAPAVVDVSALGCMDELEYELWHVIENYMAQFGIRTQDDEPDWATVKAVQESIFTAFTDAGVDFKFGYEERVAQAIKQARKDGEKV